MKKFAGLVILLLLPFSFGYCEGVRKGSSSETLEIHTSKGIKGGKPCGLTKVIEYLRLTIKSDKEVYEAGEEIKITCKFKNESNKEIIFFWSKQKPEIFTEEAGVYIISLYIQTSAEPLYVKPKEDITKTIIITLNNNIKPIKGKIGLQFLYNAQAVLSFFTTADQKIQQGRLFSDVITIAVTEKKNISREKVIQIAREACEGKMKIPVDAPIDVSLKENTYIVIFKNQLPFGVLGANYLAQVTIAADSGRVLNVLVGG